MEYKNKEKIKFIILLAIWIIQIIIMLFCLIVGYESGKSPYCGPNAGNVSTYK